MECPMNSDIWVERTLGTNVVSRMICFMHRGRKHKSWKHALTKYLVYPAKMLVRLVIQICTIYNNYLPFSFLRKRWLTCPSPWDPWSGFVLWLSHKSMAHLSRNFKNSCVVWLFPLCLLSDTRRPCPRKFCSLAWYPEPEDAVTW
jgi:hypothetical protein